MFALEAHRPLREKCWQIFSKGSSIIVLCSQFSSKLTFKYFNMAISLSLLPTPVPFEDICLVDILTFENSYLANILKR